MIDNAPLVSVIVPNYNHSQFLDLRLESIYKQTEENIEVILLDDSSTDSSREILSQYQDHPKTAYTIFNQKNSGNTFVQWDKGLKLARGKYVWIAESDDYCKEGFLETVLQPLEENPGVALAFCQSHEINSSGKRIGNWINHTAAFPINIFHEDFIMEGNFFIEKFLIHRNVIPNVSAVLFRREDLVRILPLKIEPFLKYNADWFYYIQLLCNSKVSFVAESLNYFRSHENSVIGKAGDESGWINIFHMELEGRKKMLTYLRDCKPKNFSEIKTQSQIGNLKLQYLIVRHHFEGRDFFKAVLAAKRPALVKELVKLAGRKIYKKWMGFR